MKKDDHTTQLTSSQMRPDLIALGSAGFSITETLINHFGHISSVVKVYMILLAHPVVWI